MAKENPTKCQRCGSEQQPINVFNPNTPGVPTKRVDLCATCTARDPQVTFVSGPGIGIGAPDAENVPDITPAVPLPATDGQIKEFGPKVPELTVPPVDGKPAISVTGHIANQTVEQKIAAQEKDIDTLIGKRRQMQAQLNEITNMIIAKRGAVAGLRDLLGNK